MPDEFSGQLTLRRCYSDGRAGASAIDDDSSAVHEG